MVWPGLGFRMRRREMRLSPAPPGVGRKCANDLKECLGVCPRHPKGSISMRSERRAAGETGVLRPRSLNGAYPREKVKNPGPESLPKGKTT